MQKSLTLGADGRWYIDGVPIVIGDITAQSRIGSNTFFTSKPPSKFKAGDKWINSTDGIVSVANIVGDNVYWVVDGDLTSNIRTKDIHPVLEELADVIIRTVGVVDYAASSAGGSAGTVIYPTISDITFSEVLGTSVKVHCSVTDAKGYNTTGLRFRIYKKLSKDTNYVMHAEDILIGEIGIGISTSMVNLSISTAYDVKIELYDKNSPSFTTVVKTATITTGAAYLETPTISISGYPDKISTSPTLTASAFTPVGASDTYVSTTFRIKQGTTIVWESTVNDVSVTIPDGYLKRNTAYTFEVYHTGNTIGNSGKGTLSATTANGVLMDYLVVGHGGTCGTGNGNLSPGEGGEVKLGIDLFQIGYSCSCIITSGNTKNSPGDDTVFGTIRAVAGTHGGLFSFGQTAQSTLSNPRLNDPYGRTSVPVSNIDAVAQTGRQWVDGNYYGDGGDYYASTSFPLPPNFTGKGMDGGSGGNGTQPQLSGVIKIRYPGNTQLATGGTITISGGYVYHTFTSTGTFTVTG